MGLKDESGMERNFIKQVNNQGFHGHRGKTGNDDLEQLGQKNWKTLSKATEKRSQLKCLKLYEECIRYLVFKGSLTEHHKLDDLS